MLLNGGIYNLNVHEYRKLYDRLIVFLNKYKKNSYLIKDHPNFKRIELENIDKFQYLPSFLPVNLVLPCFKITIGIESATLYEFANSGGISISLINMCSFLSTEYKATCIDYLQGKLNKDCKIFFSIIYE